MESFLVNITSFPTAIYTTLLVVVIGYWFVSFFANFDLDDFDIGINTDVDIDTDTSEVGKVTGLLSTLGLTGVPITIVITFLVLNAWFICYFLSYFVPTFPNIVFILQATINIGITIVSFMLSILVSAIMIKPLKPLFKKLNQEPIQKSIIGSTCRIRSSRVDDSFGEADCLHEGASLIIKVRAKSGESFSTGESVVVIEHNAKDDTYSIVSERDFNHQVT